MRFPLATLALLVLGACAPMPVAPSLECVWPDDFEPALSVAGDTTGYFCVKTSGGAIVDTVHTR